MVMNVNLLFEDIIDPLIFSFGDVNWRVIER